MRKIGFVVKVIGNIIFAEKRNNSSFSLLISIASAYAFSGFEIRSS
jgi:hypothetical protein